MPQQQQKFEFQAEIRQLLDIVVHSLYTEKEIFVRELVSNASDALEKMRHLSLTEKEVFDDRLNLEINVTTDDKAKSFTIQDFGVGMTRAELIENLGTIAHSGSKAFLQALGPVSAPPKLGEGGATPGDQAGSKAGLIGQFGVGFYSAFMVAKSVRVYSHSWRAAEPGQLWASDGTGSFSIEESGGQRRGAKIVIELRDECAEFSQEWRVKEILQRYSAFVSFPINLNGTRINTVQALWLRNKPEITEKEYSEFYKYQAHDSSDPRLRLHFSADAPLAINALLFVPKDNPESTGLIRAEPAVALYSRKVLIDARPKDLLPEWLRFLKGVVDCEDLPLNISRETMQDRTLVEKLNKVVTNRFLKLLDEEAKNRPDSYAGFYGEFGVFLKEGAALDFGHRTQLAGLLRFESSLTDKGKTTSFADYVSRMKDGQKGIYYLVGSGREAIEAGPYVEGFRARNLEVLYCYEAVDEYVMNNLREYDGKALTAADYADVKLGDLPRSSEGALSDEETKKLVSWMKESLGGRVSEVRAGGRLVDSPALALNDDRMMSPHLRRMMKAMQRKEDEATPLRVTLEINPRHAVIRRLSQIKATDPGRAALVAEQILDNALISAGLLEDAAGMVKRMYKILETA